MSPNKHIQSILDTLPDNPGCYLMKNADGKIIYVGKAINLKNRVRSYFHASGQKDSKTKKLVENIADIEFIIVDSELEALILEMNLIKKHRPKYNVRLKDDKRYPYIKVSLGTTISKSNNYSKFNRRWFSLFWPLYECMGSSIKQLISYGKYFHT